MLEARAGSAVDVNGVRLPLPGGPSGLGRVGTENIHGIVLFCYLLKHRDRLYPNVR